MLFRSVEMLNEGSNFRWFHKGIVVEAEESEKDIEASASNINNEMSSGAAASGGGGDGWPAR